MNTLRFFIFLVFSLFITACDKANIPSDIGTELALTVTGAASQISVGDTVNLTANLSENGAAVNGATFTWTDKSTQSIALASSNNTAHFVAPAGKGQAIIEVIATIHGVSLKKTLAINIVDPTQSGPVNAVSIDGLPTATALEAVTLTAQYKETGVVQKDAKFIWTQDQGLTVTPVINNGVLSFTAPDVNHDTEYTFSVTTTNDDGIDFNATKIIKVAPKGIAFTSQSIQTLQTVKPVTVGHTVHLTANAQQSNNNSPSLAWTQVNTGAPTVTLTNANTQTATFVAPSTGGKLTFKVTATGSNGKSTSQLQTVNVIDKPVSSQQGSQHEIYSGHGPLTLNVGKQVGTGPFTYVWAQTAGTHLPISNLKVEKPIVTPPVVQTDTDFTWQVTVTDANNKSTVETHTVTVKALNVPLKLVATILHPSSPNVAEGESVSPQATITGGTGTYSIRWSSTSVTLKDATTETPSFVVPAISKETKITLNLEVSDGTDKLTRSVSYTAKPLFIVNPHQNQSGSNLATGSAQSSTSNQIESGKSFKPSVDIHENTATGGTFTYAWTVVKPSPVPSGLVISGANTAQPIVVTPTVTSTTPVELQAVVTYTVNGKSTSKTVNSTYQIVPTNAPSTPPFSLSMAGHESVYGGRKVNPTVSVMNAAGTITYKWTQLSGPTVVIADDTTDHPSFTTPTVSGHQDIVIQVEVSDGTGVEKAKVTFAVDPFFVPAKLPLTVVASKDDNVIEGGTVNPRASVTNYYGTPIYAWTQVSGPAVVITGADTQSASFTVPVIAPATSATVVLQFTVTDPDGSTATDTVNYQIQTAIKVKASASTNAILEGEKLSLVASTADVNGTASYIWSVVSYDGTGTVSVTDATMAQASIDIPAVSKDRTLVLQVIAIDSANAQTAISQVTVSIADRAMSIDLGADAHIPSGQTGHLHANVLGGLAPFTYTWTDSSPATLAVTNKDNPSFTAPTTTNQNVDLQFDVDVTDSLGNKASSSITMTVDKLPPTFNIVAPPTAVNVGDVVNLTTNLTDNGNPVTGATYVWIDKSTPSITLSSTNTSTTSFTVPSGATTAEFEVTTTLNGVSITESISINILDLAITITGAPSSANVGDTLNLTANITNNGAAITPDSIVWTDNSAKNIALASTGNKAHFVAASGITKAEITVEATFNGASTTQNVSIDIAALLQATDIDALSITGPTSVTEGHNVILNALVTKTSVVQQNAIVTWQQDSGTTVTLTPNDKKLSFTAPSVNQDTKLTFSAQHTNSDGVVFTKTWDVTVKPIAIAFTNSANTGQSQTTGSTQTPHTIKQVTSGDTVHLTTQAALAGGGGTFTYAWQQIGSPAVPVTITNPNSQTASFVAPDAGGKLTFTVTATETGSGKSTSQTQQVTVIPKPPAIRLQGASHEVLNSGATLTLSVGVTGGTAPFTYNWQASGAASSIALSSNTAEKPTATLPIVSVDTDFTWTVTVADSAAKTASTDHVVTVKAAPKLAVTILHPSSSKVSEGDTVSPQATITGGTGTYSIRWSSTSVTLTGETTETPSFVVPSISKETKIILSLVVSDGTDTLTQSVSYTAEPLFIINPHQNQSGSNLATGPTQSTHQNNQIESGKTFKPSIDVHENTATGGTFTYAWTVVKPSPVPSDLVIAGANTAQPIVIAPTVTSTTPVELQAVITYTAPNGKSISKTVNSTYQIVPVNAPSKPPLSLSMAGHESVYGGRKVNPTVSVINAAGTISYKWTQLSGPTIVIADDTTDHPSFTTPAVSGHQDIVVQVEVGDGHSVEKAQVTFAIDPFFVPAKLPLTVVASGGSTVIANATVNPRASVTNSNGTPNYSWSQTSGPAITITNPSSATPSFTAPAVSGTVVVEVSVTDADNSPVTGTITYQVQTAIKVKASASTNAILEGEKLDLVATSSDVNGTASYVWSVVSDGGTGIVTADITTAAMAQASIDIPAVDQDRTLVLQVVATDSANAQTATSQVSVGIADRRMRLDAGADAHIPSGQTGNLHTNVLGGLAPFTYVWTDSNPATLVGGPTDTNNPSFTAPTVAHSVDLQFDVTVTDSLNNTASDSITMTVDQPPFSVNAGVDFSVTEGVTVQLGATDLNGTGTTWSWSQTAGQTVSLSDATIANPTFTAPAKPPGSKETFSFTVTGTSNGQAKSDTVNVVVQGVPDIAAHANGVSVHAGATVTLAGSVTGPGTVAKLEWSQASTGVSVGTLTNATVTGDVKTLNTTFVAPAVTADTILTFDFLATGTGNSNHVSVNVTIFANPLTVSAGNDIRVRSGATVQLHAVSSNAANYAWSQTVGTPTVTLINGNTNGASFVAPNVTADTTLTFQVVATDGSTPGTDTVDVVVYEPTIVVKTGKPHRINLLADDSEPPTWIDTTFADSITGLDVTPATTTWTITPILTPQATMDAVFVDLDKPSLQINPLLAAKGTYTATITAGDSANHYQAGSKSFVIDIQPAKPATPPMPTKIDLSANTGLTGIAGAAGNHSLHAPTITGGVPPYKYAWGLGVVTNGLTVTGGKTNNPTVDFPGVTAACTEIKGKISLTITDANGDAVTGDIAYSSVSGPAPIKPISCHLCRGPKFICERSHVSSVCTATKAQKGKGIVDSALQYCINDIENLQDGSRYVTRRCATAEEVNHDWFIDKASASNEASGIKELGNLGRLDPLAHGYNVVILKDRHMTFSMPCKGDDCNLETVPDNLLGVTNGVPDLSVTGVPPTPTGPGVCP